MRVRPPAHGNAVPALLAHRHARAGDGGVVGEEVGGERSREVLDRLDLDLSCQRVDGVLHRVRRKDVAVVAPHVGVVELALESHGHREIAQLVASLAAAHLHEPHARFPVAVLAESCHGQLPR
jgi:dihydropteroate synthase